jgi:hypothetical protein
VAEADADELIRELQHISVQAAAIGEVVPQQKPLIAVLP